MDKGNVVERGSFWQAVRGRSPIRMGLVEAVVKCNITAATSRHLHCRGISMLRAITYSTFDSADERLF